MIDALAGFARGFRPFRRLVSMFDDDARALELHARVKECVFGHANSPRGGCFLRVMRLDRMRGAR